MQTALANPQLFAETDIRIRQAAQDSRAAIISLARRDPNVFASHILRDEETGLPIAQGPQHRVWQTIWSRYDSSVIWAFTGAGKSAQITARILREIGENPNIRIAVCSATSRLAKRIVGLVGRYITDSTAYHEVYPHVQMENPANWSAEAFYVKRASFVREPTLMAVGVHTGVLGSRFDLVILDDVVDLENSRTESLRVDTIRWIKSTLFSRFMGRPRVIAVGNAYHPEDLLHDLEKQPAWAAFRFPVYDNTGAPAWPARWPVQAIESRRAAVGELEFARQMLCQPRADLDSRFQQAWIDAARIRGNALTLVPKYEPANDEVVITGVDLGVQRKSTSNLTVLFTIVVNAAGDRRVLNIEAGKWPADGIIQRAVAHSRRYNSILVVENNAAQDFLIQIIRRDHPGVVIREHTTGRNKAHPVLGIEAMAVEFSKGQWIIPSAVADPRVASWVQDMLFYDPTTHTGDYLSASWIARTYALKLTRGPAAMEIDVWAR